MRLEYSSFRRVNSDKCDCRQRFESVIDQVRASVRSVGMRGASDAQVGERVADSDIVFVTQDDDFFAGGVASIVMVSRVRQSRPLADRIEVRRQATAPRCGKFRALEEKGHDEQQIPALLSARIAKTFHEGPCTSCGRV